MTSAAVTRRPLNQSCVMGKCQDPHPSSSLPESFSSDNSAEVHVAPVLTQGHHGVGQSMVGEVSGRAVGNQGSRRQGSTMDAVLQPLRHASKARMPGKVANFCSADGALSSAAEGICSLIVGTARQEGFWTCLECLRQLSWLWNCKRRTFSSSVVRRRSDSTTGAPPSRVRSSQTRKLRMRRSEPWPRWSLQARPMPSDSRRIDHVAASICCFLHVALAAAVPS